MRVVLVGWGNATSTQLLAYERLYRSLGHEPRSVIPDTKSGLLDPNVYREALAPIASEIDRSREPVVVHSFSDNGFVGWAALLERLETTEVIKGVVMDSSPGLWNVRGKRDFARRFALGMTPLASRVLGLDVRERIPFVTPMLGALFLGYQLLFPRAVRTMIDAGRRVAERQPKCPHLFLYGGKDVLVRPDDVRAWIALQRERGIPVKEELFEDARHVALYPADPRRYRAVLDEFLRSLA